MTITLNLKSQAGKRGKRPQPKINAFLAMCREVAAFMVVNNGGKFKAYVSPEGSGALSLYLMTTSEVYDFELSAKLSEFAGPYIERGMLDSVTLLPASSPEDLAAFFDPDSAVRVEIEHA